MIKTLRESLIGSPLPTARMAAQKLDTLRALATLSPDALSSIAYANQEIFLGLAVAGGTGLAYGTPIALAIVGLLAVLTMSYSQVIREYPSGGGSYTVAKENLGVNAGLIAAAALLIDYVLAAAVSLTAGVAALTSAFPTLSSHRVSLALFLLLIITVANLRGMRESSALISAPVFIFVIAYLILLALGIWRSAGQPPGIYPYLPPYFAEIQPVSAFLILHTFASGCTALTGIESISNGVLIFKPPESKHAAQAMRLMALLMFILFIGTIGLSQRFAILPSDGETILSALARHVMGSGPLYLALQTSTLLILLVAANTSFAGFPRVAHVMARDGYLPRQLSYLGDRLVFTNGMLLLSGFGGLLIVLSGGDTHTLIPLFAVGAFLAFTLAQAGMVAHWFRERGPRWQFKTIANAMGALTTTLTLLVVAVSKFRDGAWLIALLIPLMTFIFHTIHTHYQQVAGELSLISPAIPRSRLPNPRVVIPIAGVHRGVIHALRYALSISSHVTAVHVEVDEGRAEKIRAMWEKYGMGVPLEIIPSPYRSFVGPFLDFLDRTDQEHDDGFLASVIIPEFIPAKWWENLLHNQTAWSLRIALLYRRHKLGKERAIIDVPMHLQH